MAKRKIIAYWLILTAVLVFAWAGISAGDARAHYSNSTSWYTVMAPQNAGHVTSNCLVSGGQTVLLGSMELAEKEIPFTLRTPSAASGTLQWSVDQPQLLQVQMLVDGAQQQAAEAIALDAGEKTVVMKLIPTPEALETDHDAANISVDVVFTTDIGSIAGTFLVTMPENILPSEPEQTEPTEPVDPAEPTDPTDPEHTDPTDPEGAEPVVLTETEPTEPETSEPTQPETSEPTEPETSEPAQPETSEPTDPETSEPTEPETSEPTQPEPPAGDDVPPAVQLGSLSAYDENRALPVTVSFPENTDRLTVSLADEQGNKRVFPAFTRYSADGGSTWFLLYYGGAAEIGKISGTKSLLLLDFTGTSQAVNGELTLRAEAFSADVSLGYAAVSCVPGVSLDIQPGFLTQKEALVLELPSAWKEYQLTYEVELLTAGEVTAYVPVTLSPETLNAAVEAGEEKYTLTLRIGTTEDLPPAGTYRLTLAWNYEGYCFAREQIPFFINYSSDAVP